MKNNGKKNKMNIEDVHTRQLLSMRDYTGWYWSGDDSYHDDVEFSQQEIYAELAKREHIPSKKEAKIIRQQKAQHERNR